MRQSFFGLVTVFALLWLPAQVAAESCIACRYFDTLELAGDSQMFSESMKQLEKRPLASVSLGQGAFCETGQGALMAGELTASSDRQFIRAEQIARKSRTCSNDCAPTLNEAEYCAYRDRLVSDRYRLGAVALRLADLAEIYERSGRLEKLPLEVLSADMTLYGGEALNVLTDALKALDSGNPGLVHDIRWQASSTEVSGLFDAVALLTDFSLFKGDTALLEAALETAAEQLATVRDPLFLALTRTRIIQPSEQRALEKRILRGASSMAWVIASLQTSAERQLATSDAAISTDANSVLTGRDPLGIQGAVGCLNKLSLSAFTSSEAPELTVGILDECRSFGPCRSSGEAGRSHRNISPLRAFLETQDEAEKQTFALVNSMCVAN